MALIGAPFMRGSNVRSGSFGLAADKTSASSCNGRQ
jgi:hypothetical protein